MPAYVHADIEVTDPALYDEYRRQVAPTIAAYGGRFLVRGGDPRSLEAYGGAEASLARQVILEFPDMATLEAWYRSPEYAPLIALRQRASRGRLVAMQGA